ncbi:gluconolactonase convert D-glucono-1 [Colletotrichum graminicola M1.001]|uniref:Gluconolactonase convert D-glucono-1 n=1 Tax=Colletotrichum graminicola (strain M1.001 / M2 / FGSC 10212) TaxID=645133 RepID=E3QIA7_COLGM|nr:gluconolactonase convert D-glucono-1 [Colletotrichum graminicola M1.001]EFQ30722.1 gluconolactonase convert D-glucono-1 [Colletotrichum graminicola M1.001]
MNFYPVPPTIKAELHVRVPDHLRSHLPRRPVADEDGNLFIVDVPYGRILKISPSKEVSVAA